MDAWDRAVFVAAWMPRFSSSDARPSDHHPLRKSDTQTLSSEDMKRLREEGKKLLPDQLTEEEKEARWRAICRKHPK